MNQTIGHVEQSNTNRTVVSLTDYGNKKMIDIRDWFKTDKMENWAPTKRGVKIPIDKVGELVSLCEKTEDAIIGTNNE